MLTFSDPQILRMAREDFIPVACDDWYQRRREDAEGEFFRAVANQGPREHDGAGGPTRQGLYLFTAGGNLLGYKNHSDPEIMRRVVQDALAKWKALGEGPQLDIPPSFEPDQRYHREAPKGALVLRTFTRELSEAEEGELQRHGKRSPARDHLWILEGEWRALLPSNPEVGALVEVPEALLRRLVRFHLVDATRGEPPFWAADQVRSQVLILEVSEAEGTRVQLKASGAVALGDGDHGFEAALLGTIELDTQGPKVTRFDLVALGEHWGEGSWNRGARGGRAPLGIVFRVPESGPLVPPQAARDLGGYLKPR